MSFSDRNLILEASFRDYIIYGNGVVIDTGWESNQPQDAQALLTMQLYMESLVGSTSTVGGIQYMAFGQGDVSWDTVAPTLDPTDTTLLSELGRVAISRSDMVYLDPSDDSESETPTRKVQIEVFIPAGVGTGDWREFCLYGGNASDTLDSGIMINWFNHAVINKTDDVAIQRTIKIKSLITTEFTIVP